MDFFVELIHEIKDSLKCNIQKHIVFIASLTTNLLIIETMIFPKSLKIDTHE